MRFAIALALTLAMTMTAVAAPKKKVHAGYADASWYFAAPAGWPEWAKKAFGTEGGGTAGGGASK
jgi:hypothetical protein